MKVFVTDDERARIEQRAKATGLSISAYLRTAGLGIQSSLSSTMRR
jgi:hypothetical protein